MNEKQQQDQKARPERPEVQTFDPFEKMFRPQSSKNDFLKALEKTWKDDF